MDRKQLYPLIIGAAILAAVFFSSYVFPDWNWRAWFTGIVFVFTFAALIAEIRPPHITMFLSSSLLVVFGIISPFQFMQGFSNDILMTIAMLCIVVRALEVNGVLNLLSRHILSRSKKACLQLLSVMAPAALISAFTNNTPIVLMMTPLIRKWALNHQLSPSKFLIPLSYASILGGMCTLIGTSTNLIVEGLLRRQNPAAQLSFFELSYVGVPCLVLGIIYLLLFSFKLLPAREDPASIMIHEAEKLTVEFIVQEECPVIGLTVDEAGDKYFHRQTIVEIHRQAAQIEAPSLDMEIVLHDRLIFAADVDLVHELKSIPGLAPCGDSHFHLDSDSSHFSEVVIARTSLLIGKTLKKIKFRNRYGATVISIYRQGKKLQGGVENVILQAGDTLMLFSPKPWEGEEEFNNDFYFIRLNEKIGPFNACQGGLVISVFIAMIILATFGVSLMVASVATVLILIFTRSVTLREAQNSIVLNILVLIGSSFAFGAALESSGAAQAFASFILKWIGTNPYFLVGGILLVTIVSTEVLSNNATALLLFPIAIEIARAAGYQSPEAIKAIGVAVAFGSTCGFALPTGYQTHMIIYGPGGYRFRDFIKIGLPLNLIIWTIGTLLIPYFWPLELHS